LARESRIVLVDGTPVVPGAEEIIPFGVGFVDLGEFLDEFSEFRGGNVEEGEEGLDEGRGSK
jgi:hypothetical protein